MDHIIVVYCPCEHCTSSAWDICYKCSDILQLCRCGHAPELLQLQYEAGLGGVVRGSWLDRDTGNLLVVDSLGHILQCSHGYR